MKPKTHAKGKPPRTAHPQRKQKRAASRGDGECPAPIPTGGEFDGKNAVQLAWNTVVRGLKGEKISTVQGQIAKDLLKATGELDKLKVGAMDGAEIVITLNDLPRPEDAGDTDGNEDDPGQDTS